MHEDLLGKGSGGPAGALGVLLVGAGMSELSGPQCIPPGTCVMDHGIPDPECLLLKTQQPGVVDVSQLPVIE